MQPYLSSLSEDALLSLGSMEGLAPPAVEKGAPREAVRRFANWPGYGLAGVAAAAAYGMHYLPFPPFQIGSRRPLSTAILAILAGMAIRNLLPLPAAAIDGAKGMVKRLVPLTIVLTGAGLNLTQIASVGPRALGITVLCVGLGLAAAYYCGKLFGLWRRTAVLIGAGTAICGTSAIVAVAPLIDAEDDDLLLSIGTVNLLGLVLMIAAPLVAGVLELSEQQFAVWAGTSIHTVPQVVAAAFAYSPQAGALATLVKLVRVTLLVPFVFVLAAYTARRHSGGAVRVHYARLVPAFLWGFLAVALLNTLNVIPVLDFPGAGNLRLPLAGLLVDASHIVLTLAMAAIGLEVNTRMLARVGGKAILTGAAACLLLSTGSLLMILLLL